MQIIYLLYHSPICPAVQSLLPKNRFFFGTAENRFFMLFLQIFSPSFSIVFFYGFSAADNPCRSLSFSEFPQHFHCIHKILYFYSIL